MILSQCWKQRHRFEVDSTEEVDSELCPPDYDAVIAAKDIEEKHLIRFKVNGSERTVSAGKDILLGEYLREYERLTGLKLSCREGGCGSCTVLLSIDGRPRVAVNACLRKLSACHNCEITTVEGLGTISNPSVVQKAIVDCDATQCGQCTSGMVTTLTQALEQPKVTAEDIEKSLAGNLCRCTGYRRILDAGHECLLKDIEDLGLKGEDTKKKIITIHDKDAHDTKYFAPRTLAGAVTILFGGQHPEMQIIAANTGSGVSKYYDGTAFERRAIIASPLAYCDVSRVYEMRQLSDTVWGGAVALSEIMSFCQAKSTSRYQTIAKHLGLVANPQVRSVGTLAGNLSLALTFKDFPSDLFLLLETLRARVDIFFGSAENRKLMHLSELQALVSSSEKMKTTRFLIVSVRLPPVDENELMLSHKVSQRHVNAHAIISVGLFVEAVTCTAENQKHLSRVSLCFGLSGSQGGIIRAIQAEQCLANSELGDDAALQSALAALETVAEKAGTDKAGIVRSVFFKIMLQANGCPMPLERPVSRGQWDTSGAVNPTFFPVSKPDTHKLSALQQAVGTAIYTDDLPRLRPTLFGAFVLATSVGTLQNLDTSQCDDEMIVITADDLKQNGLENAMTDEEDILTPLGGSVMFAGQRLAMVLASSRAIAEDGARLVSFSITPNKTAPILTIEDAIAAKSFFAQEPQLMHLGKPAAEFLRDDNVVVEGTAACGHQAHFYLEQQVCRAVLDESEVMRVDLASQDVHTVAKTVAACLKWPQARVMAVTKRAGGAYGGKCSRSVPTACAAAVAAFLHNCAVCIALPIEDNMASLGSRRPHRFDFRVAVSKHSGRLQAVTGTVYADQGCSSDFGALSSGLDVSLCLDGPYSVKNWLIEGYCCKTNKPSNTYCRGPVFLPAHILIEAVIEAVASKIKIPTQIVRELNIYQAGETGLDGKQLTDCTLAACLLEAKRRANFEALLLDVERFNQINVYVKRGIALSPLKYAMSAATGYTARVTLHPDGSVLIEHSGSELGQGLNVKQAQVAAQTLGCDLSVISVAPVTSRLSTLPTGGSTTSEGNAASVRLACEKIQAQLLDGRTWVQQAHKTCLSQGGGPIIASATYTGDQVEGGGILPGSADSNSAYPIQYECFGAAVSLIEYDALAANPPTILKTVLVTDQGTSMNPNIDAGQAQGAFIMGLGYLTSETFAFDPHTGVNKTCGTWDYKIPSSLDIPLEFDVVFLANHPNAEGIYSSKAVGEPATLAATSVLSAIRHAVNALRQDDRAANILKEYDKPILLSGPATPAALSQAANLDWSRFSYTYS